MKQVCSASAHRGSMLSVVAIAIVFLVSIALADVCSPYQDCNSCFYGNGNCGWCTTDGTCQSVQNRTCNDTDWQYRPTAILNISATTSGQQISADRINVFLRAGQTLNITITVTPSSDYPVDLYYLMDFSASMLDDVGKLATVAAGLTAELKNISSSPSVGFGSFIDKNIQPISDNAYIFYNWIPLTQNFTSFNNQIQSIISTTNIIANYDTPEGGGEALMQVLTCTSKINWRPGVRKIVVYASDADFHMAGDAYVSGITRPNSGTCQMTSNSTYDSSFQDYPSAGQLKKAFDATGIIPIFLIYDNVADPLYVSNILSYKNLLPYLNRGYLGSLTNDSSNAVSLFKEAYKVIIQTISPQVIPNGAESLVSGITPPLYQNVSAGTPKTFTISLTWDGVTAVDGKEIQIDFLSFGKLGILVNTAFKCVCPTTCKCPFNSVCDCGKCICDPGFIGPNCTCDLSLATNQTANHVLCSNIGTYLPLCKICICPDNFSGVDCSCAQNCPNDCNGNGVCNCGSCDCADGWTGTDCSCDDTRCRALPGQPYCSSRGTCNCETCFCNPGWLGQHCDFCDPSSPLNTCKYKETSCQAHKDCSTCLRDDTCSWCPSINTCYESNIAPTTCDTVWTECQTTTSSAVGSAVGGTIGAIVGLGLAALLVWKTVIYFKDKKEWEEFEKQRAQAAWSNHANPAFKSLATEILNPTFGSDMKY